MAVITTSAPTVAASYATGTEELSAKVLAKREQVGRKALADFAGSSQSAVWRWERSKIHTVELAHVQAVVAKFDQLTTTKVQSPTAQVRSILAAVTADTDPVKLAAQVLAILTPPAKPKS